MYRYIDAPFPPSTTRWDTGRIPCPGQKKIEGIMHCTTQVGFGWLQDLQAIARRLGPPYDDSCAVVRPCLDLGQLHRQLLTRRVPSIKPVSQSAAAETFSWWHARHLRLVRMFSTPGLFVASQQPPDCAWPIHLWLNSGMPLASIVPATIRRPSHPKIMQHEQDIREASRHPARLLDVMA